MSVTVLRKKNTYFEDEMVAALKPYTSWDLLCSLDQVNVLDKWYLLDPNNDPEP